MAYASLQDRADIIAEMPWQDRDVPVTSFDMLCQTAEKHGDRLAVTFQLFSDPSAPFETLSWSQLKTKVIQTANLFRSLGQGEDDVVAYIMPNCNETVLTYLAGQVAGIVNPINPLLDAQTIAHLLRDTGAKTVVTLKSFPKTDIAQRVAEAVSLAGTVNTVIEVDLLRYLTGVKKFIVPLVRPKVPTKHGAKVLDFTSSVAAQPETLTFEAPQRDRVAALFHTGGTTGTPKIAQHKFSGIVYNSWLGHRLLFTEHDVQICPLPMFHVFAAIVSLGASLGSGAQFIMPTPAGYRGDGVMDNFWKLIERHKVTFMITVPTAISALMQRKVDADISSLKLAFCGSAPLPVELYKRFEQAAGVTVCEGYGLTEATCLVAINPPDGEKKIGSVGFPFPYTDVKIMDLTTGQECPTDTIGEICVSNPGIYKGKTYTDPSKNEKLFYPGAAGPHQYLRTGDLGRFDADGYLWITGRAKDLILRSGHNIDPAQIEEALVAHPDVAFAGAIGQPDAYAGELPCAYVELTTKAAQLLKTNADDLTTFIADKVQERVALPKHIEILPELPKTAVGKVFKPALRQMAIRRIYDSALQDAGLSARVKAVVEDKKHGLKAVISKDHMDESNSIATVLGEFIYPWRFEGES